MTAIMTSQNTDLSSLNILYNYIKKRKPVKVAVRLGSLFCWIPCIMLMPTAYTSWVGLDSSLSRYSDTYRLDGPGIESRWGARFSAPVQTGPEANPASCTIGTGSFPEVKCGRGVLLTTHPLLLVPRSWKSRAIPLPTLWATSVL